MSATPMIIDCDPGHDDALAIMLAHRVAAVTAITTVAGNAPLEHTTRNALAVVELLEAGIPVHSGAALPLDGTPRHATHVHGKTGFGGVELPAPRRTTAGQDAVTFLIEFTRKQPGQWIVPIGPLTNIALALQQDPTFTDRIAGFSIMGGSTNVGNSTTAAEFNIFADPEAADVVFRSGVHIRMCGLNLTSQLRSSDAWVERLRASTAPQANLAARLYDYMHERMETMIGHRSSALHDPCAVLAVTHPELFEFEELPGAIELTGEHTRGMTVFDQRPIARASWPKISVAMKIDAPAALALLESALTQR